MAALQPDISVLKKFVARDWTGEAAKLAINYARSKRLLVLDRINLM